MYEVWSLGHKPFDDLDGKEVAIAITIRTSIFKYRIAGYFP